SPLGALIIFGTFASTAPSFYNLQILPKLLKGENIANLITILGGVDIVLGEVDG
ncbi:hypothetical protein ACT4UM_29870, partial [Bacillus sp. SS-TM]